MTQPPSAAALTLADWMRSYFLPRDPWAHPDNRLDVATKLQKFAAQAVAAERARCIEILHEEGWLGRSEQLIAHPEDTAIRKQTLDDKR